MNLENILIEKEALKMKNNSQAYSAGRRALETIALFRLFKSWLSCYTGRSWTKYIPNSISFMRLPATIFVVTAYAFGIYTGQAYWSLFGWWFSIPTMLSDVWDGALAELWQVKSELGMILDPVVDKILIYTGFPGITYLTWEQYYVGIFSQVNLVLASVLIILELDLAHLNKKNLDRHHGTDKMSGASEGGKIKYTIECILLLIMAGFNIAGHNQSVNVVFVNSLFAIGLIASMYFALVSRKGYKQRLT